MFYVPNLVVFCGVTLTVSLCSFYVQPFMFVLFFTVFYPPVLVLLSLSFFLPDVLFLLTFFTVFSYNKSFLSILN